MIIDCLGLDIDTDMHVKQHKLIIEVINKTKPKCERNSPEVWFCRKNKLDTNTYFELHYNENGSELKKIRAWDVNPDYIADGCYFEQKGIDISINERKLFKRHWWN